jgi:hypothetical protein
VVDPRRCRSGSTRTRRSRGSPPCAAGGTPVSCRSSSRGRHSGRWTPSRSGRDGPPGTGGRLAARGRERESRAAGRTGQLPWGGRAADGPPQRHRGGAHRGQQRPEGTWATWSPVFPGRLCVVEARWSRETVETLTKQAQSRMAQIQAHQAGPQIDARCRPVVTLDVIRAAAHPYRLGSRRPRRLPRGARLAVPQTPVLGDPGTTD